MKSKEDFENHSLWPLVEELRRDEGISELPLDTRQYLRYLLEHLDKRRKVTNHYFVRRGSLDELRNHLEDIRNWIPSYVDAIDSAIDDCMRIISSEWPANNGRAITDIVESVRDSYLEETESRLEEARSEADKVSELKRQFEVAKDEIESRIEELRELFENAVDETKTNLDEQRESLSSKFESEVDERAGLAEEKLDSIEQEFTQSLQRIKGETEGILEEVKNTANAISGTAMTTDYAKYAKDKEIAVWIYDVLAILFAVAGIALVGFALTGLQVDATSASVFKLAVSVASFTVSGFLFKRGTSNQREAKAARRTELTLREYSPFIANLSDDEKRGITNGIAERIFIKGEIGDRDDKTVSNALLDRGLTDKQIASLAELFKLISKE